MKKTTKICILGVLFSGIFISGCANNKIANTEILSQQAKQLASSSTLSPQEAILASAKEIEKSQNDQLHFYAPLHFNAAQDALTEAQDLLNNKADKALVLEQTFKVSKLLKSAYTNKSTVLSTLNKSLAHKQTLEELGSPEVLPEDFQDTVDDLKDLIKEIEGGFMDKALSGQATLISSMTELEIATLKKQHLSQAESMIDKAESIDADEYAEKTFKQAEQTLESAILFIEKNYSDRAGVRENGLDALNAASHAYYIAKESTELVELKRADAEKKALYFESLLERINKSLGVEHLNTLSLYDQSVALAEKVESMKQQTKPLSVPSNQEKAAPKASSSQITEQKTISLETRPISENKPESTTLDDIEKIETESSPIEDKVIPPEDKSSQAEDSSSLTEKSSSQAEESSSLTEENSSQTEESSAQTEDANALSEDKGTPEAALTTKDQG